MKKKLSHKIIKNIFGPVIYKYLELRFNFSHDKCDLKPPFLVFANHTMDYDAFFVSASFKDYIYFVMSDHVSSLKRVKFFQRFISPIPITKSTIDAETVKNIYSILHSNGIVGIFPEGNKSFAGTNSYIKPSTVKLVKKAGVPLVLYNIIGGYLSSPRWGKTRRRGRIKSFVKEILYPEQIKNMTDDELYKKIVDGLHVNAYEEQEKNITQFLGRNKAQNIESLLYYCPICGGFETIYGDGDNIKCKICDLDATYNIYGYIENAPFTRLDDWDKFQKQKLSDLDLDSLGEEETITSRDNWMVQLKATKYKSKTLGEYRSRITKNSLILKNNQDEIIIPHNMITGTAIEGVCSVQISLKDGRVYRLKNNVKNNGLKIVNIISRLNNVQYNF